MLKKILIWGSVLTGVFVGSYYLFQYIKNKQMEGSEGGSDAQACADSNCTGLPPSELGECLRDCISSVVRRKAKMPA